MTDQKPEKTNPAQSTETPEPNILPPEEDEQSSNITIIQTIIQHTEKPEKVLEVLEEHSPGFIKRTIQKTETFSEKSMESRFKFGERQVYTALFLRVLAAIAIFLLAGVAIFKGSNFFTLFALVIFYAVAQGGTQTWRKIGNAIAEYISRK